MYHFAIGLLSNCGKLSKPVAVGDIEQIKLPLFFFLSFYFVLIGK